MNFVLQKLTTFKAFRNAAVFCLILLPIYADAQEKAVSSLQTHSQTLPTPAQTPEEQARHELFNLIHSNKPSADSVLYKVMPGDTIEKIAKNFSTTPELIKKRNQLTSDFIKAGQELSIWKKVFHIKVDKTTNRLWLMFDNTIVKEYVVSTGKSDTTTPTGEFTITTRYPDPTWFHHGDVIAGDDPANWLGTRWLGFDKPKYGIHGTIFPETIGQSVSGGCVRMKNEDVEELYDMIPVGTKVVITQEKIKE